MESASPSSFSSREHAAKFQNLISGEGNLNLKVQNNYFWQLLEFKFLHKKYLKSVSKCAITDFR